MKKLLSIILFSAVLLGAHGQSSEIHELNGKVGIGTNNPTTKLQVANDVTDLDHGGQVEMIGATDHTKGLTMGYNVQDNFGFMQMSYLNGFTSLLLNPKGGKIGVNTLSLPYYDFEIHGSLSSTKYKLGTDLCILPIANGQSVISTFWGLQLVGNKQAETDYTPSNIGQRDNFSVAIPNQQADKIGLVIQGATSQTGDLMQWQDKQGSVLARVTYAGNIITKKLKVTQTPWPDYVFHKAYKLPMLEEVETFIQANHHLPGIPSTAEVEKNGVDVGENQALLLRKVEELTLYLIEQNKKLADRQKEIDLLKKQLQDRLRK